MPEGPGWRSHARLLLLHLWLMGHRPGWLYHRSLHCLLSMCSSLLLY